LLCAHAGDAIRRRAIVSCFMVGSFGRAPDPPVRKCGSGGADAIAGEARMLPRLGRAMRKQEPPWIKRDR
jgi:hypothetical protein